jgi:aminopeptidase N
MAPIRNIGSMVVGALVLAGCSGVADVRLEAAPSAAPTPTAALEGALPPPLAAVPEAGAEAAAAAEPTGVAGRDGVGDSLYPRLGNGGYDVTHYDLDVHFTPDGFAGPGTIVARATIVAETTDDLVSFNLDLSGLDVSAVSVDDRVAGFDRSGSELTIVPAAPLPGSTEFVTIVDYSGAPAPVSVDETSPVNGWTPSEGGIFVAGEPTGASGWFPVNDHPSDRASYTITVTAPDDLAVASNGILESRIDTAEDGTTTWRYEAAAPMASYLVTLAIDDLTFVEQGTFDGVLLRHAFASEVAEAARADTDRLPEVLEYFTSVFGPFPFDVYGHLVVDTPFGAALETQTLTVFGSDTIAGTGVLTNIVVHELAHQWFGDAVGLADWGDLWLNEGFATYAELLWFEHDGRITRDQIGPLIVGNGFPLTPPGRPDPADLFSESIYFRGALTLHAVRLTVGDDAFFDVMRGWTEAFGGATATTDDFIELAEATTGQTLRPLIEAWLYDDAMPELPPPG